MPARRRDLGTSSRGRRPCSSARPSPSSATPTVLPRRWHSATNPCRRGSCSWLFDDVINQLSEWRLAALLSLLQAAQDQFAQHTSLGGGTIAKLFSIEAQIDQLTLRFEMFDFDGEQVGNITLPGLKLIAIEFGQLTGASQLLLQ